MITKDEFYSIMNQMTVITDNDDIDFRYKDYPSRTDFYLWLIHKLNENTTNIIRISTRDFWYIKNIDERYLIKDGYITVYYIVFPTFIQSIVLALLTINTSVYLIMSGLFLAICQILVSKLMFAIWSVITVVIILLFTNTILFLKLLFKIEFFFRRKW